MLELVGDLPFALSDWLLGGALYMYYVVRVIQMVERSLLSKVAWVFALSIAAPIAIPIAWWKMDRRP